MMMMLMANRIGRATDWQARATRCRRDSSGEDSRNIRSIFSTTTTAPSTIMPMAMAIPPSDIRLAEMSKNFMARKVKPTENGIDSATTRLGLNPPINANSTSATRIMPCSSALITVLTAALTRVAWS